MLSPTQQDKTTSVKPAHTPPAAASPTEHTLWEMSLDLMATASLDGYWTRLNAAWDGRPCAARPEAH
jgi:hypothetical protein